MIFGLRHFRTRACRAHPTHALLFDSEYLPSLQLDKAPENHIDLRNMRHFRKGTAYLEDHALSRKPRRSEKTAPYRENAHHARSSLHDIVEKLTANNVRCEI